MGRDTALAATLSDILRVGSMTSQTPAPIGQDRAGGVVAGCAGDAAAGVRACAAKIQALERAAIVGIAEHRSCPEQLIERERAMKDVAAGETEYPFEVERAQHLAAEHAGLETRRIAIDSVDHQIGHRIAMRIPGTAVRQFG